MDQFDGDGRAQGRVAQGLGAERGDRPHRLDGRQHEQRAQALAAVEHAVAHGLAEARGGIGRDEAFQRRLDRGDLEAHPVVELVGPHASVHGARRPSS